MGPSGVCFVIVRKDLMNKTPRSDIIYTSNWGLFNKSPNMYFNTPCTWAIYVSGLNIANMIKEGGLKQMEANAVARSSMIYNIIDSSEGFYINKTNKKYRSRTNVVFRINMDKALETKFVNEAATQGLVELAAHPATGGIRASMYNAMKLEGAEALAKFMKEFKAKNGGKAKL